MIRALKQQQGFVSILSVIVMMLLLTAGIYMLSASNSGVLTTGNYRDGLMAQYAAELGAKHAIYQLKYGTDGTVLSNVKALTSTNTIYKMPNVNSLDGVLPNTTYAVQYVWRDENTRFIEAVGTVNGKVKRRVTLFVDIVSGAGPLFDKYVIYAKGTGDITNNQAYIKGNVGAIGNIRQYGGTIDGDVSSSAPPPDGYRAYNNSTLTGKWTKQTEDLPVPATLPDFYSFDASKYSSGQSLSNSIYGGGTQTLSGVYYVNNTFEMGTTTFNIPAGQTATIYAEKNIRLNSGTVINGDITLIAGGGSVELNGAQLSAPNGNVNICANGYFHDNRSSSLTAANVLVEAVGNIELNGSPVVNNQGTIKMYTKDYFHFNQTSVVTGSCLVMAAGDIEVNAGVGENTMFISNGSIEVNQGADIAQTYAAKNFANNGGQITYIKGLAQKLGMPGQDTLTFYTWSNQPWNNQ